MMNVIAKESINLSKNNQLPPQKTSKNPIGLPDIQHHSVKIPQGAKKIGNYILGKTIGAGSFGKVHLGMHLPTSEKVAVKIIEKQKIIGKDIQRVKNEIQILRTTRHRNLIHLYQIIETEKSLLLITEHMPNGELFNRIIKEKKLAEPQACYMFHQVIEGVQYLHEMGIAHRDLKPENVMIDYDNQLKLIDFGLSKVYSHSHNEKLSSACGSPCYASPEMIESKAPYNPELVDVWSCGVMLYAMVSGSLPFVDTDTAQLYKKILAGVYKPLKGVSESLKDLIEKMLIVNPKKRIKLKEIKQHEWWNSIPYRKGYGLYRGQRTIYDEELVMKTTAMGFERAKIIESLQNDEKNKETGAYYLLMKKMIRANAQIPSYIGNSDFDVSCIESMTEEGTSETVDIEAPQCESPSVKRPPQQGPMSSCTCTENTKPFEWWVFIGTKEYEKYGHKREASVRNHCQNIVSMANNKPIIRSLLEMKKDGLCEQKRLLQQEEDKLLKDKEVLKNKKANFYANNEKNCLATAILLHKGPIADASFFYKQENRFKSISLYNRPSDQGKKKQLKKISLSTVMQAKNSLPPVCKRKMSLIKEAYSQDMKKQEIWTDQQKRNSKIKRRHMYQSHVGGKVSIDGSMK